MVDIGKAAPAFKLAATGDKKISLRDFKGKYLLVYFYPKDNTPGCTREGQDFRDHYQAFKKLNCEVLGVSRDTLRSHDNFRAKYDFPFDLVSDPDEKLCQAFAVIRQKKLYGRTFMGVVRSTFLLGPDSKLRQEWRNIKVPGHVEKVLDTLQQEQS